MFFWNRKKPLLKYKTKKLSSTSPVEWQLRWEREVEKLKSKILTSNSHKIKRWIKQCGFSTDKDIDKMRFQLLQELGNWVWDPQANTFSTRANYTPNGPLLSYWLMPWKEKHCQISTELLSNVCNALNEKRIQFQVLGIINSIQSFLNGQAYKDHFRLRKIYKVDKYYDYNRYLGFTSDIALSVYKSKSIEKVVTSLTSRMLEMHSLRGDQVFGVGVSDKVWVVARCDPLGNLSFASSLWKQDGDQANVLDMDFLKVLRILSCLLDLANKINTLKHELLQLAKKGAFSDVLFESQR